MERKLKGPKARSGGEVMRRLILFLAMTLGLSGFLVGVTTVSASAHQGNIVVDKTVCVDNHTVDVTYKVSWANVPTNAQNTVIGSRTGTTTFNSGWDDTPATATAWANVPRGAVGSEAGSRTWTVRLDKSQFGGTNSANGPWEYAHFPWTNGNTGSRYHDTRVEGFDWNKCTTKVTAAAFTTTPETCTSNGSLSIPAQSVGVIVKVNGNTVAPPWSTTTPGSYNVVYSAASGYQLTNNPSGTSVVKPQLGIEHCTHPAATITVSCSGFVVNMSNTGGQVPATFTVTRPDGSTETVVVQPGGSATRTYPVVEDQTVSVTVTAPGMQPVTKSYHADCVAPLPSPPTSTTPDCTNPNMTVSPGTQPSDTWSPATSTVLAPGQSVTYTVTPTNPNQSYPAGTQTVWPFANTFDPETCLMVVTPGISKSTPSCDVPNITVTSDNSSGVIWTPQLPAVLVPGQSQTFVASPAQGSKFPQGAQTQFPVSNTFDLETCNTPPPPKVVKKWRSALDCGCVTENFGEFQAKVWNDKKSTKAVWAKVTVNGKVVKVAKVAPGKVFSYHQVGVKVGSRVKLYVAGKLVKNQVVPDGCETPQPPPGGLPKVAFAAG